MSIPAFVSQKLPENTPDNKAIVKVFNQLDNNLNNIFQYNKNKMQLDSVLLQRIQLVVGVNNIPHTLNRVLTGWSLTRKRGPADIYDTQDSNTNKGLYLQLVSDAVVVIDLLVF